MKGSQVTRNTEMNYVRIPLDLLSEIGAEDLKKSKLFSTEICSLIKDGLEARKNPTFKAADKIKKLSEEIIKLSKLEI